MKCYAANFSFEIRNGKSIFMKQTVADRTSHTLARAEGSCCCCPGSACRGARCTCSRCNLKGIVKWEFFFSLKVGQLYLDE